MEPSALWSAWAAAAPGWISPVYPLLSALHIAALGLLLGAIVALDLQLLRPVASPGLAHWARWLSHCAAVGLGLAVLSGFLLFSVQPEHYLENPAFRWKLALLALGVANALVVHRLPGWRAVLDGAAASRGLRLAAALSLSCWLSVIVAGRYIAFV